MDNAEKQKVKDIISREIALEDDMLGLYSGLIKTEDFLNSLSQSDKDLVNEIINILLRDTARHKQTMEKIIIESL
ncbi:MAG: hypothetical protein WCW26_02540 [Candidatus Buchananbacteria bacterium]